ncbi:hypothetical protein Q9L58_004654 [Maublancomyces gigas]|uniref:F-box domain-containing protein n=1 Tax=Discina gigas TaxID=1032678 RepID=A0ABR3GKG2_9PEZI
MAAFLSLPNELIRRVGDYLPDKEVAHLSQASWRFKELLSPLLLKRALEDKPPPVVKINALLWAVHYGHTGLVETIVSQPDFSRYYGDVYHALDLAAELGRGDIIKILISAGYEVEGSGSKTPLHIASINGHANTVTQLIAHGADINKKHRGVTALVSAIQAPRAIWRKLAPKGMSGKDNLKLVQTIEARVVTTIQVLLNAGAYSELRTVDHDGNTPLHHAVFYCLGSTLDLQVGAGILRLLVQSGSSLSARNHNQYTPLELTAQCGCSTALTFFLDIGLSPNTKGLDGRSLLSNTIVCTTRALSTMQVLLDKGATTENISLHSLFCDAEEPDPILFDKILTLLLIHGASFGEGAGECFSYAAMHGMLAVMKVVFETCPGVDINTAVEDNDTGRVGTALQLAIDDNRADIVKYLVQIGVEMSVAEKGQVEVILG